MKSCDICGTLNLKENNYCTHCGNKLIMEHICPHCGKVNPDIADFCVRCHKQINPLEINDFDTLFNEYNDNLLKNAEISYPEYKEILNNIFARADYLEFYGNSPKEKLLRLASIFTECKTKSRGYERGFFYLGNCIYYDDRMDESVQISTIIHELAHYLLFSIVENLLCHIFRVESSTTLQSFVWFFLTLPEFRIMNEYCAHTVEGRFLPFGYQNYGSFNYLIKRDDFDKSLQNEMVIFGNSFSNEIILYLQKYIDEDLRDEIKLQYKKDLKDPSYESILIETDDCWPTDAKNKILLRLLYDTFEIASSKEAREDLEDIKKGIELD